CFYVKEEAGIRDRKLNVVQTCALPIVGADHHHHRGGVGGQVGSLLPQLVEGDPLLERLHERVVVHHLAEGGGALPLVDGERGQLLLLPERLGGDRGGGGDRQLELVVARVMLGEVVQRDHHVRAAGLLELAHHELPRDRKSTRLNSSHVSISDAV